MLKPAQLLTMSHGHGSNGLALTGANYLPAVHSLYDMSMAIRAIVPFLPTILRSLVWLIEENQKGWRLSSIAGAARTLGIYKDGLTSDLNSPFTYYFFKKIGKALKSVVKGVGSVAKMLPAAAPIMALIPGVGPMLAAGSLAIGGVANLASKPKAPETTSQVEHVSYLAPLIGDGVVPLGPGNPFPSVDAAFSVLTEDLRLANGGFATPGAPVPHGAAKWRAAADEMTNKFALAAQHGVPFPFDVSSPDPRTTVAPGLPNGGWPVPQLQGQPRIELAGFARWAGGQSLPGHQLYLQITQPSIGFVGVPESAMTSSVYTGPPTTPVSPGFPATPLSFAAPQHPTLLQPAPGQVYELPTLAGVLGQGDPFALPPLIPAYELAPVPFSAWPGFGGGYELGDERLVSDRAAYSRGLLSGTDPSAPAGLALALDLLAEIGATVDDSEYNDLSPEQLVAVLLADSSLHADYADCDGDPSRRNQLKLGPFYSSSLVRGEVVADLPRGVHGMVTLKQRPYPIRISAHQGEHRAAVSVAHEMTHVLNETYKLGLTHDQVHTTGVFVATEIFPALDSFLKRQK